ncbi:MAG: OPT/YSL family transporter [Bryobacteraceae bacterium]
MTVKAVALGVFLALIFGSANAYLGMKAGQTVAATFPAAVIAMVLLRIPAFRGTLLEQNIARTAASVGEALVAGAIFTIPAFVIFEVNGVRLWTDLRSHYWEATTILLCGGLLGVFFIILLRRPLVIEANLPWPESVAAANVTRAGGASSDAPRYIFTAMAFAGLVQFFKSDKGIQIFREYTEGFLTFPRAVVNHFNFSKASIGAVAHGGGIPWSTPALSPALIGIGYIIGPRYAFINVAGGILAWWVLIPLLLFFDPDLSRRVSESGNDVLAYTVWYNVVRPIAVGMMLVAAANTLSQCVGRCWSHCGGVRAEKQRQGSDGGSYRARYSLEMDPDSYVCCSGSDNRSILLVHRRLAGRGNRCNRDDAYRISALRSGRLSGRTGWRIESATVRTYSFGIDHYGAAVDEHRRHGGFRNGSGPGRCGGRRYGVLGLRFIDSGFQGGATVRRHTLEDASG